MPHRSPRVFEPRFDAVGLIAATLFAALSLLPSLLPRVPFIQGVATGVTLMIGYGAGVAAVGVWRYLELPSVRSRRRRWVIISGAAALALAALAGSIWQFVSWQNEIRTAYGMPHLTASVWPMVAGVALVLAVVVLIIGRALRLLFRKLRDFLDRWLPRRLAIVLATAGIVLLLWLLVSGLLLRGFFFVANGVFSGADRGDKPGVTQPMSPLRSGSPESLVQWDDLGRQGRAFVWQGASAENINEFTGGGALEPIRVYVGLRSADTVEERAQLLLEELQRTGAFEREVLILATTTGTGWIDQNGVEPVEYLWNGDTAIAGVQYSYLPSWISLLADQEAVKESSQVTFRTIYDYWSTLDEDDRPRLYLYGLSLGSYGVESVLGSIDIINEPVDGALMVGPPFVNPLHRDLTASREKGSTAWLPLVSDGRTVRFTTEADALGDQGERWGPSRLVYLQHGSDPVVFFSPSLAWNRPAWLEPGGRAPDVSPRMTWFPVVTMWQTLLDLPAAESVPAGYGHNYTIRANLQAWVSITQVEDWRDTDTLRLTRFLEERRDDEKSFIDQLSD